MASRRAAGIDNPLDEQHDLRVERLHLVAVDGIQLGQHRSPTTGRLDPGYISSDGTTVPDATQIVDNSGAVWTIGASGAILRNGLQTGGGGSKILWTGSTIYVLERLHLVAVDGIRLGQPRLNDLESGFGFDVGDRAGAKTQSLEALEIAPSFERAQDLLLKLSQ